MEENNLKDQGHGKEKIWTFQAICSCMSESWRPRDNQVLDGVKGGEARGLESRSREQPSSGGTVGT